MTSELSREIQTSEHRDELEIGRSMLKRPAFKTALGVLRPFIVDVVHHHEGIATPVRGRLAGH
ncbi:MAG: hypothetical protein ACI9DC_002910 [Gammaproteobacteria bacterium]|jgi:hypothetical protein